MSSWKRTVSKVIGDALKMHIVRKGRAGPLLEEDTLAQFLHTFEIDCVFDVGANAGQYAWMLRRIGYGGAIVSVEPIPTLARVLRSAAARDRRWFVEAEALSDVDSNMTFNIMENNVFSSLKLPSNVETPLFENMNRVVETIDVKATRLEDLYDRYQAQLQFRRPFLKMDTQGNDLAVARGAGERLSCFRGLQSELAIKRLYEGQSGYREAIDFYEDAGFVLSAFVPNNAGHFPDLIEIDCIMYNSRLTDPPRN